MGVNDVGGEAFAGPGQTRDQGGDWIGACAGDADEDRLKAGSAADQGGGMRKIGWCLG